jgi:hypothetical protein
LPQILGENKMFKYLTILLILVSLNLQSAENPFNSSYKYDLEAIKNEKTIVVMGGVFEPLSDYTEAAVKSVEGVTIFNLKYLTSLSMTDDENEINFSMYLRDSNNFYADFYSTECGKASFKSNTIIKNFSLELLSEKGCTIKIILGDIK